MGERRGEGERENETEREREREREREGKRGRKTADVQPSSAASGQEGQEFRQMWRRRKIEISEVGGQTE